VDPAKLQASGVSLEQVIETSGEALWVSPLSFLESSTPGTAGWIDTPNQRLSIRHLLPITSAEDLAKVAVVGEQGLLLKDVARVVEDHQPLIGDAVSDQGPGLLLVIEKFPGANTLQVTRGVEDALEAMRPGLSGIEIDTGIFRPASYIEQASRNLATTMIIALLLAALVLGVFFFNWRTALISLTAIILSLAVAVFVLNQRGASFNVMVLAGLVIALGVIIDDAIIDMENVARRLRQHRQAGDDQDTLSVMLEALLEMRSATGFATLIILVTVLPLFFLQGLAGSFVEPLIITYVLAILTSLAVALIVTPALSLILLGNGSIGRESPLVQFLRRGYQAVLVRSMHAPYLALIVVGVVSLVGLALLPFSGLSLVPSFKQTDLLIKWSAAPGTSRPEMNRITGQVLRELRAIPGVRNVGSQVGRAVTGDAVVGINSGELWVSIDPGADYDATLAAVSETIDGYPGLVRQLTTYQPERTGEALTKTDQDVVVRIYGHELDVLREKAREVQQILAGIDGVAEARADIQADEPQVEIEVDLAAAERYGIKPGDVRRQATTLLSGLQVGTLFEEQKVFEVVVWGVPEIRNSLTDIRDLLISTPVGPIPLGDVADVRVVPTPIIIKRDSVSRYIDVGADIRGRSLGAVSADIESALQNVSFPLEYHAELVGVSMAQQVDRQRMFGIVAAVMIGIFLLLQAAFGSWRLAIVASLTLIPITLAGGMMAVFVSGGTLSLGSLFGFLGVIGIAVRNGMLMIGHYQHLEQHEGETFGADLVLRGSHERFLPILMTVLTTGLALLPLVIAGGVAGNEILHPLAIVIIGGLVTSTLLNLFALPALYLRFGSSPEPERSSQPITTKSGEQPGFSASSD
jgi:Cu/Ag efflux pump CusA